MIDIEKLLRPNIRNLKPYSSARSEFSGDAKIFLDANENPWGPSLEHSGFSSLNRYPDSVPHILKKKIAELKSLTPAQVFLGHGSDEAIDLLVRCFCEPGKDSIVVTSPSYGMYSVSAEIQNCAVKTVTLNQSFDVDVQQVLNTVDSSCKLLFLCSPNNPSGNNLSQTAMLHLLEVFPGLVVVDEAYIDFSDQASMLEELQRFNNLVVLQTFSKAWGLAGMRVGMAFADPLIISCLERVKPPYNLSIPAQSLALKACFCNDQKEILVERMKISRAALIEVLKTFSQIKKIYQSDANFILAQVEKASEVYKKLVASGIVIRDRSTVAGCPSCLRFSIGTDSEQRVLIAALASIFNYKETSKLIDRYDQLLTHSAQNPRIGLEFRKTNETDIYIRVNLDGRGESKVQTGLGFFDHMLDQIARHSGIDLDVLLRGDLQIDEHHSIEDCALALGTALARALGDKRGIERYAFVLPMDESKAEVALDLGGRPSFVWNVKLSREKVGELPTEMVEHFFKSLSDNLRCNLHISASGDNEHHIIEAIFKGFARALKAAIACSNSNPVVASTKGII